MSGNRGSGFDTRWLLANFPFPLVEKNSFKCRENGKDRLRKGNVTCLTFTEKTQVTLAIYHGIPLESVVY